MKIAIITFHASYNCGSMLQAYALQKILQTRYNANVVIINYIPKGQKQFYSLWDPKLRPSILKNNLRSLPYWKQIEIYKGHFDDFKNKYMNLSDPVLNYNDLKNMDGIFDVVISGGDQIWNVVCRDADKAYFLPFIQKSIKASYSPSMGSIQIGKFIDHLEYKKYIDSYDYLSIREPNGKKWLSEISEKNVELICDPTMLLTKEEWNEYLEIPQISDEYIFYYGFDFQNDKNNLLLKNLSNKTGLPIYIMDRKSWYIYNLKQYGFVLYDVDGPKSFLTLMKNAKFVIARSFHGILFSIIYRKNFWSIQNKTLMNPNDDRASNILSLTNLGDRQVVLEDLLNKNFFDVIDYEKSENLISQLRENAFNYLDRFAKEH